jgi:hypothetical protein
MSNQPPVSFQTLAQTAGNPAAGGYPYQLRASDLDKNFVFATLDVEEGLVETTSGSGGHQQRRLRIPAPGNSTVKQNLSATSNQMEWTPAIPDGVAEGQSITWDAEAGAWRLFPFNLQTVKRGSFPQWTQDGGWQALGEGNAKGQFLKWDHVLKQWVRFSGAAEGAFPQWDAINGWESQGAGTVAGQLLKWDAIAKNWVPGPSGTINNELLRWNATDETWEPFGRGATDGQLLVAQSGGWVPFTAPPTSGTHVLGAVNGALQWIATEEC